MSEKIIDQYTHAIHPAWKATFAFILGLIATYIVAYLTGDVFAASMQALRNSFVYYLIPFIVAMTLFTYLVYKTRVQEVHGLNFLAGFVLSIGLADFFRIFSGDVLTSTKPFQRNGDFFTTLVDIMLPLAVIFLYLHLELVENDSPNIIRYTSIAVTALPLILGGLAEIIVGNSDIIEELIARSTIQAEIQDMMAFYLYFFGIVVFGISIYGFKIMYRTLIHADSKAISRGSLLMMVGFSSLLANFALLGFRDSLSLLQTIGFGKTGFTVHTSWILMGSMVVMLFAYITTPEFAYSVPFDVSQILVLDRINGITLFSYINEFRYENKELTTATLKSPVIVAIQSLMSEIAYAEGVIQFISLSDRKLILKSKGDITTVCIANKSSYFLNKGLESFTNSFYYIFKDKIKNFDGNLRPFASAKELLLRYLPFFRTVSL